MELTPTYPGKEKKIFAAQRRSGFPSRAAGLAEFSSTKQKHHNEDLAPATGVERGRKDDSDGDPTK